MCRTRSPHRFRGAGSRFHGMSSLPVQQAADGVASRNLDAQGAGAPRVFLTKADLAPFAAAAGRLAASLGKALQLEAPRALLLHAEPPSPLPPVRSLNELLADKGVDAGADVRVGRLLELATAFYDETATAVDADVKSGRLRPVGRTPPAPIAYGNIGARPILLLANFPLNGDADFYQASGELHAHTAVLGLRGVFSSGPGTGSIIINRLPVVAVGATEKYEKALEPTDEVPCAADARAEALVVAAMDQSLVSSFIPM